MDFPSTFQMVKNLSAMQKTQVQSLGHEDLLMKGMATHSSILAWEISLMEEPGRLPSMGSQNSWTWLSDQTITIVFWGSTPSKVRNKKLLAHIESLKAIKPFALQYKEITFLLGYRDFIFTPKDLFHSAEMNLNPDTVNQGVNLYQSWSLFKSDPPTSKVLIKKVNYILCSGTEPSGRTGIFHCYMLLYSLTQLPPFFNVINRYLSDI